MKRILLFCSLLPLIQAASQCPPQQNARFRCDDAAIFVLDVSSTMGTKENIQTLFAYFRAVILPQYNFKGYQPIQIMTYGANSTPIAETTDYENTVCPGMERLLGEAMDTGLQEVLFKDALKQIYHTFGNEYDTPVIIFTAANNETEIDDAIDYRHKHLKDEYFTIVAVNSTFSVWKWFQAISTYAVPLDQLYAYKNLDMCILDASCADLETFCSVYPPSTTQRPITSTPKRTTTVPLATTTSTFSVPQVLQCQSETCSCPNNTVAMKYDEEGRPVGGCYFGSTTLSNFALKQRKCAELHGFLVMDKSSDQNERLRQVFDWPNPVWLGLVFDRSQQEYFWPDNSTLGAFHPWSPSTTVPPSSGQDCVLFTNLGQWLTSDCRNSAASICMLPPCDSRGYCSVPAQ